MELAQGVVPKGQGGQVLIDELRAFLSPPAQVAQGAHSRESLIRGNQV
jgi:hypothetical protein